MFGIATITTAVTTTQTASALPQQNGKASAVGFCNAYVGTDVEEKSEHGASDLPPPEECYHFKVISPASACVPDLNFPKEEFPGQTPVTDPCEPGEASGR